MTPQQFVIAACSLAIAITAAPAYAGQPGHGGGGGGHGGSVSGHASGRVAGQGHAVRAPAPSVGHAVPRLLPSRPLIGSTGRLYPYPYLYDSHLYPRFGLGFYSGYPYGYYGYPYGLYGYPYGAYPYGYGYPGYGYPDYGYGYGYNNGYGYDNYGGAAGKVRITNAPKEAEVYVDGSYVGIVDDFDGTFQRLNLEPGVHRIELRAPGFQTVTFDVNLQPGQTINYRAAMRTAQP